jgi:hypothetical protein
MPIKIDPDALAIWKHHKQSPQSTLVVPVNCVGVLGAGMAKQASVVLPASATGTYKKACGSVLKAQGDYLDLGTSCFFATKGHWKDESHAIPIKKGLLKWLNELILKDLERTLLIPALGSGLGGLHWDLFLPSIISDIPDIIKSDQSKIDIVFYNPL